MNSLELLIAEQDLDEVACLNALQGDSGLISDLCVTAADVAGRDCFMACVWVEANKDRFEKVLLI